VTTDAAANVTLLEPQGEVRLALAALGDVGVIGSGRARARREGWDAPFRVPGAALRAADAGFANLEFPVAGERDVRPGRSREFRHDAEVCAALAGAGVRVVSLANNHVMDAGAEGLARTRAACEAAGLLAVGAGADLAAARTPARFEVRGQRVVVLAYSQSAAGDVAGASRPGVAPLEASVLREDLARWRPEADWLVVSAHWGSMYVDYPHPRVAPIARALAEGGADLVLGHHPHVLQGAERRGRALVLYSLGDGVFNCRAGDFHAQVADAVRPLSGVLTARLAAGAHGLDVAPHLLDADGFAIAPDAATAARIVERLRALSAGLAEGDARFAAEGAPRLLRYELEGLGHYLRQGRIDRIARVLLSVRPRHLPLLWQAIARPRKAS